MKYLPNELNNGFKEHLSALKLSSSTIKYYISDVRVFLRYVNQTTGEYELSSEMFESYENFLKSGRLPTKTINRKLSSLRIFNAYLTQKGLLRENIMRKVKNSSKTSSNNRYGVPQGLILFIVIILVGGFLLTQNKKDIENLVTKPNPTVTVPSTIKTGATSVPEIFSANDFNQITIEDDNTTNLINKTAFGADTLSPDSTEKIIYNPLVKKTGSFVFITPTSPSEARYYVLQEEGYFKVVILGQSKNRFDFNWLVISSQLPVDRLP